MYFRPGAICNTVGFSRYFSFGLEVNASQVWSFQGTAESKRNSTVSTFPRFHVDAKDLEHKDLKEAKGRAHTSKIRLHFFISSFRFFFRKHLETCCRCSEARKALFCPHGNQNPISLRASKNSSGPRIGSHRDTWDTLKFTRDSKGFKGSTLHGNCRCS